MITGTTKSGFAYEIEEEALDDFELLEALVDVQEGRATGFVNVAERLLGKKGKRALVAHVKQDGGRASAKRVYAEIMEIFGAIGSKEKN